MYNSWVVKVSPGGSGVWQEQVQMSLKDMGVKKSKLLRMSWNTFWFCDFLNPIKCFSKWLITRVKVGVSGHKVASAHKGPSEHKGMSGCGDVSRCKWVQGCKHSQGHELALTAIYSMPTTLYPPRVQGMSMQEQYFSVPTTSEQKGVGACGWMF